MQQCRRNGALFGLLSCGVLIAEAMTFSPAQAQTTSVGPYYAMPSWDQTLPAATRFIVLSNFASAAVLDRNTGLVWEKRPSSTPVSWGEARFGCINKTVGGQKGWRLPSIPELATLIDPSRAAPTLPPGHPFTNVGSLFYWSATTFVGDPGFVWIVALFNGDVFRVLKNVPATNWCVRGGMNADAY